MARVGCKHALAACGGLLVVGAIWRRLRVSGPRACQVDALNTILRIAGDTRPGITARVGARSEPGTLIQNQCPIQFAEESSSSATPSSTLPPTAASADRHLGPGWQSLPAGRVVDSVSSLEPSCKRKALKEDLRTAMAIKRKMTVPSHGNAKWLEPKWLRGIS